jgi:hypothetical protein
VVNEAEALAALRRPLVFGDDQQIRAIRFLDAVAAAVEQIREQPVCESCEGRGEFEQECSFCSGAGCDECDDEGRVAVECMGCNELGYFVADWPACKDDVMSAAIARIKQERSTARSRSRWG